MTTKRHTLLSIAAAAALTSSASAAVYSTPYSNVGPDNEAFPYEGKLTLSGTDSYNTSGAPGAWSYRDLKPTANPNRGWGHTSMWFLIEITQATSLTLGMSSANSLAQPGFALYTGESVNDAPADLHTYSNNGSDLSLLNSPWDKNGPGGSPGLTFTGFAFNGVANSLSGTFALAPGLYTVAFGNAADSNAAPAAIEYAISFSTVPEPSAALLGVLAGLLTLRRRR